MEMQVNLLSQSQNALPHVLSKIVCWWKGLEDIQKLIGWVSTPRVCEKIAGTQTHEAVPIIITSQMFCVADTTTWRSSQVLIGAKTGMDQSIRDTKHGSSRVCQRCVESRGTLPRFIRTHDAAVSGRWAAGMSSRFYLRSPSRPAMTEDPRQNEISSEWVRETSSQWLVQGLPSHWGLNSFNLTQKHHSIIVPHLLWTRKEDV